MIDERALQDILYKEFAKIGKSLSSPKRIELLDLLIQGPKSVEELAQATTMSVANVSQHLRTLYNLQMVTSKKEGNYVIYSIKDQDVRNFLNNLHALAEKQFMEVKYIKEEFQNDRLGLQGLSPAKLDKWLKEDVVLLDVRPTTEYESNHIDGAISMPVDELEENVSSLPADQKIVVYCRGTYCLLSAEAANLLKKHDFTPYRLEFGVQEWEQYLQTIKK